MTTLEESLSYHRDPLRKLVQRRIANAALAGVTFEPIMTGVMVTFPDGTKRNVYDWIAASWVASDWVYILEAKDGRA